MIPNGYSVESTEIVIFVKKETAKLGIMIIFRGAYKYTIFGTALSFRDGL